MNAPMATATPMQIAFWLGSQSKLPSADQIQAATGCSAHMADRMHRFAAHGGRFDYAAAPAAPTARERLTVRVIKALELQPMTTVELARVLSTTPGTIERPLGELRQTGCLRVAGQQPQRRGRPRNVWGVAS